MKHFLNMRFYYFALIHFLPTFFYSLNPEDSAAIYYSKDEFKKAATLYEKIVSEGKDSWILYYNLGNSYYKDGKLGLAILNYEKANKINPGSSDVINNLSIAEGKIIDKVNMREVSLEKEIKKFFIYRFSTTEWAWISIAACVIAAFLFFIYLFSQKQNIKKLSFWSGATIFLIFIISLLFGYSEMNEKKELRRGIVISQESKVYNTPKLEESSKKNLILHEGTKAKILNTEGDWLNIQLINGNEGWVSKKDIGIY